MNNPEELTPKQMTKSIVKVMSFSGINPFRNSLFDKILAIIYIIAVGFVDILIGLNLWKSTYNSVAEIVKDLIIFIGFMQILTKQITAAQRKTTLADMVQTTWDKFWTLDSIDPTMKLEILDLYRKTNILAFIFSCGTMTAVYSIILKAYFFSECDLVMEIWVPNKEVILKSPYYDIIMITQTIVFTASVYTAVVQVDKLLIVLIALVFVQFKLVKIKISSIGKSNTDSENFQILKDSIIHHNLLLKFMANFESVYCRLFLPTVASNVIIATICMWGFITEELLSNKVMNFCVYFTVMSQVLSYCIAGQIIQDAGVSLGRAAYECEWPEVSDYKIRMGIIMIISQSTRKINLTVGGFMVLCMESFAALCRASFSFLAFIVNVRNA